MEEEDEVVQTRYVAVPSFYSQDEQDDESRTNYEYGPVAAYGKQGIERKRNAQAIESG